MAVMGQVMSHEPYHSAPRVFVVVDNGSDHLNWKFTAAGLAGLL